jgi:hypothetical protein|tara:strand:- start:1379 stop:2056 length:678 start_codon:yes stop_codon:yes gene_type:complete
MKTLIIQVSIDGGGYAYSDPDILKNLEESLIPSVKRYCNKYNYDYKMITDWPDDYDVKWFNRNESKNKATTLIRYLNMDQPEYDRIVSLDNDIYIKNDAKPLPKIKGHNAISDNGQINSVKSLYKNFVNGGVQMVDRKSGKKIKEYFANICNNKTPTPNNHYTDQAYINYWRDTNEDQANFLDNNWNYFINSTLHRTNKNINFYHYAGRAGRKYIIEDIEAKFII